MRLFLTLVFCFASLAAEAREPAKVDTEALAPLGKEDNKKDPKKNLDQAEADAEPITPEQQAALICQTADIMGSKVKGAAYEPGVDAYGNPVAGADIEGESAFQIPEEVQVPIAIDVMAALGVTNPAVEGKSQIGTLTVFKGGKLLYNGKDITNTVEGYCRDHLKKMKEQDNDRSSTTEKR
ncbi:MAG: hypothetical protein EBQ96_01780 [Proteobacteria bacterium]|nr:hypothetical protein [Pseudomonadota bacterium]